MTGPSPVEAAGAVTKPEVAPMTTPTPQPAAASLCRDTWTSEQERHDALRPVNAFHARAMAIAVRATRVRTGDTIPAFARRCDVSTSTIRRWEGGGYTAATFVAFRRIGVDILDVANVVSRGYAEAIGSPWYEIEDARRDRGSAA